MVISHVHKYVFVECPLTASWAIRNELCAYYGGQPILHKHATYPELARIAKGPEKDYSVFATVRNPLDVAVSRYLKFKNDHKKVFSSEESVSRLEIDYSDRIKYEYVRDVKPTFADFFKKFCTHCYSDLIDISSPHLDFVIRYEQLQEGFSRVLASLKLRQVRRVPVVNDTKGKTGSWQDYYTEEIIQQAKAVFAGSMNKWGYEFPPSWGAPQPTWRDRLKYRTVLSLRSYYLLHLRYSDAVYAKTLRRIRAALFA